MLSTIFLFTFLSSIASLFLVALLLTREAWIRKVSFYLVSFGAGALLATGFTDTLPEAVKLSEQSFLLTTLFISLFFLIERVFMHFHHHEDESKKQLRLPISFLMFGDGLHNFIDGISIATTFLVSFPLGLITSIAVFIHEIPHELGDFGILLHSGYSRRKVLGFNILTGITAFVGAILGFYFGKEIHGSLPILLSLTSANFVYLSLADLLPEIHEQVKKNAVKHVVLFFAGVLLMLTLAQFLKA
ncbi:MAG: ZIP family metal transporter [Candidatus Levyibacteriota bacterium]